MTTFALAQINKLQGLPPALTAEAKILIPSGSLPRCLTQPSCVVRHFLRVDPQCKLQSAVKAYKRPLATSLLVQAAEPNRRHIICPMISVAAASCNRWWAGVEEILTVHHAFDLLNISMIHPRCLRYFATVPRKRGTAASLPEGSRYRAHAGHLHPGHTFARVAFEMHGHLVSPSSRIFLPSTA
jgi:hypothetical protein